MGRKGDIPRLFGTVFAPAFGRATGLSQRPEAGHGRPTTGVRGTRPRRLQVPRPTVAAARAAARQRLRPGYGRQPPTALRPVLCPDPPVLVQPPRALPPRAPASQHAS